MLNKHENKAAIVHSLLLKTRFCAENWRWLLNWDKYLFSAAPCWSISVNAEVFCRPEIVIHPVPPSATLAQSGKVPDRIEPERLRCTQICVDTHRGKNKGIRHTVKHSRGSAAYWPRWKQECVNTTPINTFRPFFLVSYWSRQSLKQQLLTVKECSNRTAQSSVCLVLPCRLQPQ